MDNYIDAKAITIRNSAIVVVGSMKMTAAKQFDSFAQSVDLHKKPTGTRSHFVWRGTKESGVIHVRWTRESEQTIKIMTVQ